MTNTVGAMVLRHLVALAALLLSGACATTEAISSSDLGDAGDGSGGDATSGGAAGDAGSGGAAGTAGGSGGEGGSPQGGAGGESGAAGDGGTGGTGTGGTGTGGTGTGGTGTGGTGGTQAAEECSGTPTACNLLGDPECALAQGCSAGGTCTEAVAALCPVWIEMQCIILQVGDGSCAWDAAIQQCYSPCTRAVDEASCPATVCTYSAGVGCSGTPLPCSAHRQQSNCQAQHGCTWQ